MEQPQGRKTPAATKWTAALAVLAVAVFPVVFLWGSNAALVPAGTVWLPLLAYAAGGLGLFAVLWFFSKRPVPSALGSVAVLLLFANYRFIENGLRRLLPVQYWHVLTLVVLLAAALVWACFRLLPQGAAGGLLNVLCVAFAALLVLNIVRIVPGAVQAARQRQAAQAQAEEAVGAAGKPNIYYFIFDEYANNAFMEQYYGYDNSPLTDALEDSGFKVSYDSRNDNASTLVITTNILNLEYLYPWSTAYDAPEQTLELQAARKDNALFRLLRGHGYEIVGLGHPEYYGLEPLQAGGVSGQSVTAGGQSFVNLLLDNTPLYPANKVNTTEASQNVQEAMAYFENPASYTTGSRFVITHLMLPHPPFVFDAQGGEVSANHFNDWDDKQYYLGQHQYASACMQQLAEEIISRDPGAIIAFTSDHSARASGKADFYENPTFAPEDMCRSFQAVYFGGQAGADIEGMSGLNVMRTVVGAALGSGAEYPPLPDLPDTAYVEAFGQGGGAS